jgi:hypothetical protein
MCYRRWPILLPTLSSDSTSSLLKVIMDAMHFSPVGNARVMFRNVYRATPAQEFEIRFPSSRNAYSELQLVSCGSLAKLANLDPQPFRLVPSLIVALQRTKDERVSQFIVEIAKSVGNGEIGFASRSKFVPRMPLRDSGRRPSNQRAGLKFVPILEKIRAIETNRPKLHASACPIPPSVVAEFRHRTAERKGRLLELYESQFSLGSRFAFPKSVDVSCGLLFACLGFVCDEYERNRQSVLTLLARVTARPRASSPSPRVQSPKYSSALPRF